MINQTETLGLMEPIRLSSDAPQYSALTDLALDLTKKSAQLTASLPTSIKGSLAKLVRSMNCYYSNLIEGHPTHPIDIERALREEYSEDKQKRDLQLEAKAHMDVQAWIDAGHLKGKTITVYGIKEIHRRFCEQLPPELLKVHSPNNALTVDVIGGEWRNHHVQVGRHIPISAQSISLFMQRFEDAHMKMGTTDFILASASAHHRLLWIHPFADGNGRVARLMSHAILFEALETEGLWSVARGLARRVDDYRKHLAACDLKRRNDLDGRGTLSQEALVDFIKFFLEVSIDQVEFMKSLIQPDQLRVKISLWAEEQIRLKNLSEKTKLILDALTYSGELPRDAIPKITGTGERQARRLVNELASFGVITSQSSRSNLHLGFPATLAHHFMPGLFPEKTDG